MYRTSPYDSSTVMLNAPARYTAPEWDSEDQISELIDTLDSVGDAIGWIPDIKDKEKSVLMEMLEGFAPPYCNVMELDDGTIGCFPDVDIALEELDQEEPDDVGEYLDISDHGNVMLLYKDERSETHEIWAVV